jgi:hypothetical protein
MNSEDFIELKKIHSVLIETEIMEAEDSGVSLPRNVTPAFDPNNDIEETLNEFLNARLNRIQTNDDYILAIKNHALTRISEFSPQNLIDIIDRAERNQNQAVDTIMKPFVPQQDGLTILDRKKENIRSLEHVEEQLFNKADKNVLQGMSELKNLLGALANASVNKS